MIWSIKNLKPLHYLYNWLAIENMSVAWELKFQAPAQQPWLEPTVFGNK